MSQGEFKHFDLSLVEPAFSSSLTDLIIELDYLRKKELSGSTHPGIFFQMKDIFHTLESISSARIEGNNTTLAEYIETKLEGRRRSPPSIREIDNIEKAMGFIDDTARASPINRAFVNRLHSTVVDGLLPPPNGEGDSTPGEYRRSNVTIAQAAHTPPDWLRVQDYMQELFEFINLDKNPKYDLLKTAIAHHRFAWIHPFKNGNGRTVRLVTYAMLVRQGFNVHVGRILNPTAVFCSNRDSYYDYLANADTGTGEGILGWCEYVLRGLKEEIEKVDKLLDYGYLKREILLPTINYSLQRRYVTDVEAKVLRLVVEKQVIQANDLKDIFAGKMSSEISRQIRRLKDKKMLVPEKKGTRRYLIRFDNSYLLRGIIKSLGEKGFLPIHDEA